MKDLIVNNAIENLEAAQKRALAIRPVKEGFPYLAAGRPAVQHRSTDFSLTHGSGREKHLSGIPRVVARRRRSL
jgi:hypothetical protein